MDSIKDLKEYIEKEAATDPVYFLQCLMQGIDVRAHHRLSARIVDLVPEDYEDEIRDLIIELQKDLKYTTVPLKASLDAGKVIMEYLHPKKKSIDMTANVSAKVEVVDLTADEVAKFKKCFNEDH